MVIAMHGNAEEIATKVGNADQVAYTIKHAALLLDLGERTVWQLVMDGEIDSFKVGWARRVSRAALLAYVERQQKSPAA